MDHSRSAALALDAADPLRGLRDRFDLPEGVIYLDGNSLGALPKATAPAIADLVSRQWGRDLITSWNRNGWIELPARIGALIAPLIGAHPDEVMAADSTSVNIFKAVAGARAMRPDRRVILAEAGDFPTDLHILQGLAATLGDVELRFVPPEQVVASLTDEVAVLLLTHVHYRSGEIRDMAGITAAAHASGALTVWDLSHSAGVIKVELDACRADFAVGCGYKFLNGGPGAPAYIHVARRHQQAFRSPLTGWLGHARPFAFIDEYEPGPGMARTLCGTPPMLSLKGLEMGLLAFDGVDPSALHAKAGRLGDLFIALVDERLPELTFIGPRDAARRGGQVAFAHEGAYALVQALIARGVIGDFRAPDAARFGLSPMTTRFVDVWDAVEHMAQVMSSGEWRDPRFNQRAAVT